MKSTPSQPPSNASGKMRQKVNSVPKPRKISAGSVNITPAASDSPAEPVVCTMLFSRMVARPNALRMLMDSTAIGIEAETVSPARNPTYTLTAPNSRPNRAPKTTARTVNSIRLSSVEMYVRNSPGGAVELHARSRTAFCSPTESSLAPSKLAITRVDYAPPGQDGKERILERREADVSGPFGPLTTVQARCTVHLIF